MIASETTSIAWKSVSEFKNSDTQFHAFNARDNFDKWLSKWLVWVLDFVNSIKNGFFFGLWMEGMFEVAIFSTS